MAKRERWEDIHKEYLEIIRQGESGEERRDRPGVLLADACQRIAELESERDRLRSAAQTARSAILQCRSNWDAHDSRALDELSAALNESPPSQ